MTCQKSHEGEKAGGFSCPESSLHDVASDPSKKNLVFSPSRLHVNPPHRAGVTALCALFFLGQDGCGKKKEDEGPVSAPLPMGQASVDRLNTGLGQARALDPEVAPTSTQWNRVVVIDDRRAAFFGEAPGAAIALTTEDAGKTWRSVRAEPGAWSAWSAGSDGTLVFSTGTRETPRGRLPPEQRPPINALRVQFAAADVPQLGGVTTVFPPETGAPSRARVTADSAVGGVLSREAAAMIVEEAPRRTALFYAGPPGAVAAPPLRPPPGERVSPMPMGRPPHLVSILGRDILVRPIPPPGRPLSPAVKVAGIVATPVLPLELSRAPACEAGPWSFQITTQPPAKRALLAVSPERSIAIPLPDTTLKATTVGCGAGPIVVQVQDPKSNASSLAVCDLDGACTMPVSPPFRSWPEAHEERIAAATTGQGVVAVLSAKAGERWGLYLTQSSDGKIYELPRVVGEGSGERGRLQLDAIASFGRRAILLISAEVTGTSRRGFYVMASDDGGTTWNPP